jgi:ethanolamine kinase
VVQKKSDQVIFIDMEYGGLSYAAFDIANHFCEFVGCDGELDYERWLPSKEYQMDWIQEYLADRDNSIIRQEVVEVVYNLVQQFMLCAHLLWSVWAVIQAENSDIEFDFVDYALQRFREYQRWKLVLGMVGEEE